jgi:hypothetical protein
MRNEIVLYCSHVFNDVVHGEIDRLRKELPDVAHAAIGYLKDDARWPELVPSETTLYRRAALASLPYPDKIAKADWVVTEGNNDLPVLAFYNQHPDYEFYWIVEYDVRYTGSWSDLFQELRSSDADLLATTVMERTECPDWFWWAKHADQLRLERLFRVFMPFCRISNRALAAIHEWYQKGGSGHPEWVWPSVCKTAGFRLEDIGGAGRYTPEHRRHKHYFNSPQENSLSPGTFVFRPTFKHEKILAHGLKFTGRPMLWHPIKG